MDPNRRKTLALSGTVLAALAGCLSRGEDEPGVPAPGLEIGTDVEEATVDDAIEGQTRFTLEFLEALVAEEPDGNHVVSPLSISMALAMLWAGARGETETAMADALHFPDEQAALHRAMGGLLEALHRRVLEVDDEDGSLELAVANRLWPDADLELEDEFVETVAEYYAADPNRSTSAANPTRHGNESTAGLPTERTISSTSCFPRVRSGSKRKSF